MEEMRLNKYLSAKGVCSRRQADAMIDEGRITVDGVVAVAGMKVRENQTIAIDGKVVGESKEAPVLLAVYKPCGITCTTTKKDKNNIVDYLNYPTRIYPVGRLDKESEGLVLMTNQGDLVNKILRGSNNHEKEYIVKVNKPINGNFLRAMHEGVPIPDMNKVKRSGSLLTEEDAPVVMTKRCKVESLSYNSFRIILTQGLNRQIRRMCAFLDYRVVALKRVRVLNIELGDMKPGSYREVTGEEYDTLMKMLDSSSSLSYKDRKDN